MNLNLNKPIVFFDLETTGVNVGKDRIVEISMLKIKPDQTRESLNKLVNPTVPIPKEVSEIHGIKDEDVANEPTFKELAPMLYQFVKDCDLGGYNCLKFDVPLLVEEFLRVDINFDVKKCRVVDVQNIFHKMEQRTLSAAYQFYCHKDLTNAHRAEADTIATYEVLKAQLDKYENTVYVDRDGNESVPVQNDIAQLHEFSHYYKHADLVGHIVYDKDGVEVFNFGKYKGKAVKEVFLNTPSYYDWMMNADFPLSTKNTITSIKLRQFNQGNLFG